MLIEQDLLKNGVNLMHENFKKQITPQMCIMWQELHGNEKKQYEKDHNFFEYAFESAFFQHLGFRHNHCSQDDLHKIKIKLQRDNKLNELI